mmetsp:Transcript_18865/g.52682  ORF Transcript_18865/g.52682 Transcript_18865/m.52682 type:complete len:641 (-) Transcript_18865:184-2106(-)
MSDENGSTDGNGGRKDGLLRLSQAIASNNHGKENYDLMRWVETATVDELRPTFPVLLNWCRNATQNKTNSNSKSDTDQEDSQPSTEEVVQKIVDVLWNAIEPDLEESTAVSALRMSVGGYLHTNHDKMRGILPISRLEQRTKARLRFDRPATNALNMVNAASLHNNSISQYNLDVNGKDQGSSGMLSNWGIPSLNIDLGLGLQQSSPADVCREYISKAMEVKHPFTGEKVGRMQVKKVFPSKRKPVWIEYFSADGADRPLKPDVLAKQGDDLRNDAAVTSVSNLCEDIWAASDHKWKLGTPPTVCAYNVLVTASDAGYLEMVPGKNFLDLSQKVEPANNPPSSETKTATNTGWDDVDVRKLAPSLVGSYIVNFVLGVRDRHEDNMMVVGDLQGDPKMMQIDFGYILMEYPGGVHFDMPRLTMPIALVDRYNQEPGSADGTTLMDDLQHDMLAAFLVLRRHSNQIIPFCAHLMSSSYDYEFVEKVFRGNHVFRLKRSEKHVIEWISQKLTTQWAHFYFRREVKQSMVSGYYKFVEAMTFDPKTDGKPSDRFFQKFRTKVQKLFKPKPTTESVKNTDSMSDYSSSDNSDDDESGEDAQANIAELLSASMTKQRKVKSMMIEQEQKHGTIALSERDVDAIQSM